MRWLKQQDMLCVCRSCQVNEAAVECYECSVPGYSQSEKIGIGQLAWAGELVGAKGGRFAQGRIYWPEDMTSHLREFCQYL